MSATRNDLVAVINHFVTFVSPIIHNQMAFVIIYALNLD